MFRTDLALRYYREGRGMRQIDLSKTSGVNQPSISAIEKGQEVLNELIKERKILLQMGADTTAMDRKIKRAKRSPTIRTLEKLCKGLNITLVEFFSYDESN